LDADFILSIQVHGCPLRFKLDFLSVQDNAKYVDSSVLAATVCHSEQAASVGHLLDVESMSLGHHAARLAGFSLLTDCKLLHQDKAIGGQV
jgi:hypothetical protein